MPRGYLRFTYETVFRKLETLYCWMIVIAKINAVLEEDDDFDSTEAC